MDIIEAVNIFKNFTSDDLKFLKKWINNDLKKRKKCKHLNTEETFKCYQEGYIELRCFDCGEKIYQDL